MTEEQQTLLNAVDNQKKLISEINEINNLIASRKENALKLQGIIEYLTSSGVSLSQESSTQIDQEVIPASELPKK